MNDNPRPARVVAPGTILKRGLEARGWTQQDLADITGRPAQAISEIVTGVKRITPETALDLSRALETSAELWLNLDARYQLRKARQEERPAEAEEIERKSRLYSIVPVKELQKRGWIRDGDTLATIEDAVCRFLGVRELADQPALAGRFRQSQARAPDAPARLAWAKRVEDVARFRKGKKFDRGRLREAIPSLLELTVAPESAPTALERLVDLGLRVAVVKPLPRRPRGR